MNKPINSNIAATPMHLDTLESRLALGMAAHLREASDALPYDVTERLRFARERAVAVAQSQRRTALIEASAISGSGRSAVLSGPPSVWWRLASALPLVLLVAGLVMIEHHHNTEQIAVAAEIDSALLADDLPPDAYRDPGFAEYLRDTVNP